MDIKNVFSVDTVNMKKLFVDEGEKCFYISVSCIVITDPKKVI
jgi:exosome complex RNA-binding protein Rrp42 (RNase PH superfamily)